jgi:iron complex outermembrane receptor protein
MGDDLSRNYASARTLQRTLFFATTALSGLFVLAGASVAQTTVGSVVITAPPATAPYEAPSVTPLEAIQPTSEVNRHYIENNVPLSANYDTILEITPSVSFVSPNGPGLAEAQFAQIRGFQDGQFNLTLDGIAWGDSNDFTHHTTSYLMAHDIGQAIVDRGPGTASTLGDATFGGTISLVTKDPATTQSAEMYGSFGSYNTYLGGAEIDTGEIKALNDARALIDVEHLGSDGRLSGMSQERTNIFTKVIAPVTSNTTITFASNYNVIHQGISLGSTQQQMAQFGWNYALNSDPSSQAYFGYNYDHITTDFEYIDVNSNLGNGWTIDSKLYTYAYYHHGYNGEDPNGDLQNGTGFSPNDVPGEYLRNLYRSVGDMTRVQKDFGFVVLRSGFWYDYQLNHRTLIETDDSLGVQVFDPNSPNVPGGIDREQRNQLYTFQPYFEADFKPFPGLDITPGVKWDYFRRDINAIVNQGTLQPLNFGRTWDKALPSVAIHYQWDDNWSVYAQVAEGFLAPNLNVLYTTNPAASTTLAPQTTWNYQIGGAYRTSRLTLSGDLYLINFGNEIISTPGTVQTGTIFINAGGTTYKGIEGEADYRVWGPVTVYANGSLNYAHDNTIDLQIPMSPKDTFAAGVAYDHNGIYSSFYGKYVGPQYGNTANTPITPGSCGPCHIQGYTLYDLSLNYTFHVNQELVKKVKVGLLIDNLFDKHSLTALAGFTNDAAATPLWWNTVPRNYTVTISAAF